MTVATSGLAEATRRIVALGDELEREKSRHAAERARIEQEIEEATRRRDVVLAGVPLDAVVLAESLIYVKGREHAAAGDGPRMIREAIADLALDRRRLRDVYYGTKNYDRWRAQGATHSYGRAPSHGSMIFEIGLVAEYRNRYTQAGREAPPEPAEEQIDAAIAYLHALLPRPTA